VVVSRSRQVTPGTGALTSGTAARTPSTPPPRSAARICASSCARGIPAGSRSTTTVSVASVEPNSRSARSCVATAPASAGTMSVSGAPPEPPSGGRKATAAASAASHAAMIGQRSATTTHA
jgi:hypothetical protein